MEVNELMVSWWWEVIGIVGMIGVGSLSGCLVWFGKSSKTISRIVAKFDG